KKDNDKPIGIITEKDITRKIVAEGKDPKTTPANEIMSKPLITIQPETPIYTAAELMIEYEIRRLPIVKDNQLLGIVTASDYARYLSEKDKNDRILLAMSRYRSRKK
ncbi:MAG: cyclic nucleotide-binding/CBS domain-containing protein, partial [Nitrososphaeraceae archaeon]